MAKKVESAEDRLGRLFDSKTFAAMQKKFGGSALIRASNLKAKKIPRIPTRIFQVDYALGGGFPVGRVIVIHGPKSSGKTTLVLKAIASSQQMCSTCFSFCGPPDGLCKCEEFRDNIAAFIDVEGSWDSEWAAANGVDLSRLLLSQPDTAEEALDIMEGLVRSGGVDLIALDSIAFLTPSKEIEESTSKDLPGLQPRLVGKGIRKLTAAMNAAKDSGRCPTIFFTNQIRYKVGLVFGNPEVQPGGMAPGFAASVELKVWPGKYHLDEVTGRTLHVDMNFRVTKNKTAPPKMEGEYRLLLADTEHKKMSQPYDESFIVSMSEKIGLIEHRGRGSWLCLGKEFKKKDDIESELLEDSDFSEQLRTALLKVLTA